MRDHNLHLADFNLAQKCLEQDADSFAHLQQAHGQQVVTYLIGAGGAPGEAREIADSLWADCVMGANGNSPALTRYDGTCALQTWLNTVALNKLLTRKRYESRWNALVPGRIGVPVEGSDAATDWPAAEAGTNPAEIPLIDIMREAVQAAFSNCSPEQFVMLQLVHCDGLRMLELAKMFDCSEATISRHLDRAAREVATSTLEFVRAADPWLELKWEDFVELCRTATPSCLGADL